MNSTSLCSSKLTFYPVFKVYIVLALTTLLLSLVAVCGNLTLIIHYLKQATRRPALFLICCSAGVDLLTGFAGLLTVTNIVIIAQCNSDQLGNLVTQNVEDLLKLETVGSVILVSIVLFDISTRISALYSVLLAVDWLMFRSKVGRIELYQYFIICFSYLILVVTLAAYFTADGQHLWTFKAHNENFITMTCVKLPYVLPIFAIAVILIIAFTRTDFIDSQGGLSQTWGLSDRTMWRLCGVFLWTNFTFIIFYSLIHLVDLDSMTYTVYVSIFYSTTHTTLLIHAASKPILIITQENGVGVVMVERVLSYKGVQRYSLK